MKGGESNQRDPAQSMYAEAKQKLRYQTPSINVFTVQVLEWVKRAYAPEDLMSGPNFRPRIQGRRGECSKVGLSRCRIIEWKKSCVGGGQFGNPGGGSETLTSPLEGETPKKTHCLNYRPSPLCSDGCRSTDTSVR